MIAKINGKVITGKRLGGEIGFPTVNIDPSGSELPEDGVYIGSAAFDGQTLPCVINQGFQPTLPSGERRVEAHILDFDGDLYGRDVEITYLAYLRPERKFASREELVRQISEDTGAARKWFEPHASTMRPPDRK